MNNNNSRHEDISDSERLARIETKIDEVLKPLQAKMEVVEGRVGALEQFRSYAKGGIAVIVMLLTALGVDKLVK